MFGLDDGERKFSVLGLSNNHMGGKQNRQTKGGGGEEQQGTSNIDGAKLFGARPGFEPGTSRTLSENHTPRPTSHTTGRKIQQANLSDKK